MQSVHRSATVSCSLESGTGIGRWHIHNFTKGNNDGKASHSSKVDWPNQTYWSVPLFEWICCCCWYCFPCLVKILHEIIREKWFRNKEISSIVKNYTSRHPSKCVQSFCITGCLPIALDNMYFTVLFQYRISQSMRVKMGDAWFVDTLRADDFKDRNELLNVCVGEYKYECEWMDPYSNVKLMLERTQWWIQPY